MGRTAAALCYGGTGSAHQNMQSLREKIKNICLKGMHVFGWASSPRQKIVSVCLRGSVAKPMHHVSGQLPVDGALHFAFIDSQIKVFCSTADNM